SIAQRLAVSQNNLVAPTGQYALVIREFPIHQLGSEGEVSRGRTNMMSPQNDIDQIVSFTQQPRQLKDTLARYDQLILFLVVDIGVHSAHRHAMAICGNGAQLTIIDFQQHTVEVIAYIL